MPLINKIRNFTKEEAMRVLNNPHTKESIKYLKTKGIARLLKVAFLFTVNKRDYRHVIRMLKNIYSPHHFYYFHVDKVRKILISNSFKNNYFIKSFCIRELDILN